MKSLLIVLALLSMSSVFAQNWSQPINVSNQDNTKNKLDFCVDNSGAIHCVWMGGDRTPENCTSIKWTFQR
jgi:hypothetical protein